MDRLPIEIASILSEVDHALERKLYYLAIAVSLSLPDICACLEFDPDDPPRADWRTYSKWADDNIGDAFKSVKGIDLYRLRCGILHFGKFEHDKSIFDRVIFIGPESRIKVHDVVITVADGVVLSGISAADLRVAGKVLHMDVVLFCKTITDAVKAWAIAKGDSDPYVKRNMPRLIRYRPDGLPPFSVGVPTIA